MSARTARIVAAVSDEDEPAGTDESAAARVVADQLTDLIGKVEVILEEEDLLPPGQGCSPTD